MTRRSIILSVELLLFATILTSCVGPFASKEIQSDPAISTQVQSFLDSYTKTYVELYTDDYEADWLANIKIVEGDTTNAVQAVKAASALAEFTGSLENIETARKFLEKSDQLEPIQILQLKKILRMAANNPANVPELVAKRIKSETYLNEILYGFDFKLDSASVTTNEIDDILKNEWKDLDLRRKAWESSKEVGVTVKPVLVDLIGLRNSTVQALGYDNFFQYMVSEYGMTTEEMIEMMDQFNRELRPLYRELHTWARYTLAERYGQPVPEQLPADWLPNRWGQSWSPMISVEGIDLDEALKDSSAEFVVRSAENFYVSLGYPRLPDTFYERSSLYPLPADAGYKKNNHASAWHMDLNQDVRSLMSVEPNEEWWETVHHELGHVYYYLAYSNPNVPPLLRRGANRAYHEAIGSLLGLASMQRPYLVQAGLVDAGTEIDPIHPMLKDALANIAFVPWSCGVMTHFEKDLYAEPLDPEQYNSRWWEYKYKYQGIVPPEGERGEEYCDAGSKTHISDDPAGYYDYAISYFILLQLHSYIAEEILQEDAHATNYYGREDVGQYLWSVLDKGATIDWRNVLLDKTGSKLSAQPVLDYFQPLMDWLQVQNEGRTHTLPELDG